MATVAVPRNHKTVLVVVSVATRLTYVLLAQIFASLLPLFDASPRLFQVSTWTLSLLRWDSFHFAHIAEHGYMYEYEWAFLPGVPLVMRTTAVALRSLSSPNNFLLGGALAVMSCDITCTLYDLSLHHLGDPNLAFLAALMSLIPSSPATIFFAPYNESFFTYLSYRGMLYCARLQWSRASIFFALAAAFRSNGILLGGFILWGSLVVPFLQGKRFSLGSFVHAILLTSLVFLPFIYHNYSAYLAYCSTSEVGSSWCQSLIPSIYGHVQAKYWDVGIFRYWKLQQIPNFFIAAPPLLSLYTFSVRHLVYFLLPNIHKLAPASSPFSNSSLTPHAIHTFIICSILLFASHTQIVLRLAASLPTTYWAGVWLLNAHPALARVWITWSIVWGLISVVLWSAFLPPA